MPKSGEVGSPKWISKQMKMKGLQKLRWYCQSCEKQCRDANGYKLHVQSPSHVAKQQTHTDNNTVYKWSSQFESDFIRILKTCPRDQPITANKVYNELIQDKNHVHLNSTRWRSLTAFINHLASRSIITINASEPELVITYRDLAREEAKARQELAEKQRLESEKKIQKSVLETQLEVSKSAEASTITEPAKTCQRLGPGKSPGPASKPGKISFSLKK